MTVQPIIDSYELHLLAEGKSPKTVRTYTEVALGETQYIAFLGEAGGGATVPGFRLRCCQQPIGQPITAAQCVSRALLPGGLPLMGSLLASAACEQALTEHGLVFLRPL